MCLRMAELAWSFLEPENGRFDFAWLDEFIDMAYKEGIEVILGTPTETSPK
ncbi:MAG: beta-galactosidase [Firmicutes bacterium]|nr:beta-galactosidase [Bacillota bacterium]